MENNFFLNEEDMVQFIKELLSINSGGKHIKKNMYSFTSFEFKGNISNVQKNIFEWLSLPERKENFNLLSD